MNHLGDEPNQLGGEPNQLGGEPNHLGDEPNQLGGELNLQHVNVKIPVEESHPADLARVVEVFHRLISRQGTGELLIDVADYRHVPAGPGVVLVGFEADYSLDQTGNRPGLRYNRKAELAGTNEERLRAAVGAAARACLRLEKEIDGTQPLRFSRRRFEIYFNDRALAPNTAESRERIRPLLDAFLERTLGHGEYTFEFEMDERRRLGIEVEANRDLDLSLLAQDGG